jgi:tryptophan-rich sensory protein
MDWNNVIKLAISILASFAARGIGSLFTFKAIPTWYVGVKKPRYTPPNRVFGPIWTTLYILIGISVFLVWQKGLATDDALLAFVLFWIQLAINAANKNGIRTVALSGGVAYNHMIRETIRHEIMNASLAFLITAALLLIVPIITQRKKLSTLKEE